MRSSAVSLLATSVSILASVLVNAQQPTADLGYVQVQGKTNESTGVDSYLGIKYAAAPIGDLRWKAPVPIEFRNNYTSDQFLDATAQGVQCIQGNPTWIDALISLYSSSMAGSGGGGAAESSEDCLLLDVFAPSSGEKNLPVQIWIHGGGYTFGSAANAGGEQLVSQSDGKMVYVSIQYRLGTYGFLSSSAVKENGSPNAGLLDMRAAIDWVNRNIHAFGGDASKVTISGGSAGGGAVTNQLILYGGEANPPFRAAIPEYPWWQTYKNDSILDAQYHELLTASNCTGLACLRALPEDTLANATQMTYQLGYENGLYAYGDFYYGPAVDGEIIRDLPSNEFKQGHFSKVALLTDHDGFEGVIFTNFSVTTASQALNTWQDLWPSAGEAFWTRLAQLYPTSDFAGSYFSNGFFNSSIITAIGGAFEGFALSNSEYWRAQSIYGDFIIDCPTYYMASAFSNHNLPTYKLIFNSGTEVHSAITAFLQGDPATATNPTQAKQLQDYYISFVRTLDPNAETYSNTTRPHWPQYLQGGNGTGFSVMEVNQTAIGVREDADASPRCDFFHAQAYTGRN